MPSSSPGPGDLSSTFAVEESLSVLLIEDNPGDARLFEEYLAEGPTEARVRHEESLQAGLEALGEAQPDVLVVDLGLPDSEGSETVRAAAAAAPEVPIVVLTGQGDLQAALEAQEAGAAEYLQKEELTPALAGRTLRWAVQQSRMQDKLRQRDAWIRSITEGLSAGVFRVGPTGRVEYANEALAEMLGLDGEEALIGEALTEFYAEAEDRGRMLAEEGTDGAEVWFERADGSTFMGLLSAKPAYDASGKTLHYDGTITDITQQKEREKWLRMLSEAVEQAKEAVLITEAEPLDEPGPRIEYVNAAYEKMTGYSREEIRGKTPRVSQGPETDREVLDSLRAALEAGEEWEGETVNYRKDGEPYVVNWNVSPVRGEDGSTERWVSVQRDVTDRKEAEEELRRSQEQLSMALEGGSIGTWNWDVETGEVIFNRQWAEMLGYSREELDLRFSTWERLVHPEDLERAIDVLEKYIEGEIEIYDPEIRMQTKSGEWKWIQTIGKVVDREEDGTVTRAAGIHLDIDERKQAEEALQEREAQLRGLANSIPGVVFQAYARPKREYGFYFVSEHAGELLGISTDPADFFERCISRVPESERDDLLDAVDQAVDREGHLQFEVPFVTPSGDTIWLLGTATPEPRDDELLYNGVILDVSERKRQQKRLATTVERVTNAIVEVDSEWRFTLVNDQAEALYDMSENDLLGRNFWDVFEEALGTRFEEEYRGVMQSRTPTQFEEHYTGLDGWFDIQVYPNDDGGLAFYFTEITERKEREQALREAKEEAERMNQLKIAFLANMSHEIRTPLTSILGFAEAIAEEVGSASERGDLDLMTLAQFSGLIEKSGRRLMDTLTGVLNLSKLEAGEMNFSLEPIDVIREAKETADQFELEAEKAGIELKVDIGDTPIRVRADESGVGIVLRNLLSNAIKYTEDGGQVWVRTRAGDDMVALEVEDTGIGMDPENTQGLFEAFKQASEGVGRSYEGTGLGLAVTQKVLDQMGGSIEVETEKGTGSRFTVRLPRAEEEVPSRSEL